MKIATGSDHAGLRLRREVVEHLEKAGHTVVDLGTQTDASVDYPDFARAVAEKVAHNDAELGILVCGTGIGMSMAANRVPGVRAAVCTDDFTARMSRAHNNANVLCMGERVIGPGQALSIVNAFLSTPFEGGRHARRVDKIHASEPTHTKDA